MWRHSFQSRSHLATRGQSGGEVKSVEVEEGERS